MNLVRWDPYRELEEMSDRLSRVFSSPTMWHEGGKETMTVADWSPAVDISETDKEYIMNVELPEVKKEDVKVTFQDGVLIVQGERKQEKEEKGRKYHRLERSYGSFVRSFTVPDAVDEAKVTAEFKDGMLNLRLPKSEKARPQSIDVKIG